MNIMQRVQNAFRYEPEISKRFKVYELPINRQLPSVDLYMQALDGASSKIVQHRTSLYDFYHVMLRIDSYVASLMEKRLENIGNKTVQIEYDGKPMEELDYFFTAPKFRTFLEDVILTKFWGFNLFEFDHIKYRDRLWFDYSVIPHKHVNPYRKEVLANQMDMEGTPYDNKPGVLFVGDVDDLGLFSKVTLLSIYKRLGLFNYSKYVDLASENFTQLKVKGYVDDSNIHSIQQQLEKRAGGVLSVPEGMDMEFDNQTSTSQNQLFENYMKLLQEELAILILGQNMTTQDGSSRSQAEVHKAEQNDKFASDERYILDVLNYEFVDFLPLWGFEYDTSKLKFKFLPNTSDELKRKLEEYKTLKDLGVVFTDNELRDTFKDLI